MKELSFGCKICKNQSNVHWKTASEEPYKMLKIIQQLKNLRTSSLFFCCAYYFCYCQLIVVIVRVAVGLVIFVAGRYD